MNNIFHTIQHTARAATVLLLALLTAQTAGAQTNVSNAAGFAKAFSDEDVSVVNVTNDITGVGGLPPLDRDLTINLNGHTISGDYLHFDVDHGLSLTINEGGQDGSVGNIISGNAYGSAIDNDGTLTLSHVNITTNYDRAIGGTGMLYIGNNVSFNGWTQMPFDIPYVNIEGGYYALANFVATVTVGGKTHYFENLSVALVYFANNPGNDGFSLSGDTYTIKTAADWGYFCDMLEAGETFSGKTVKLDANIGTPEDPVTRMGSSTTQFRGTFDGAGHTLTVQYGTPSEPVNQQFVAPFPIVEGAATFRNLTIAGSIYSGYTTSGDKGTGGLIGCLRGSVTVEHCVSTVTVNAASDRAGGFVGLCEHAVTFTDCVSSAIVTCTGSGSGFVGWSRDSKYTIAFYGCLFSGKVLKQGNVGSGNGSFVGWKGFSKTVTITNCIATPATDENMATDNSVTFCRYSADTTKDNGETDITNCYYTQTLGNAQGKQAHTVTAGTDVTVAHAGVATHYATSGITAYKATGASTDSDLFIAGLLYNNNVVDVLYAGSDEVVSLTLSNTAPGAPDGYQYGYTTNAGTLKGSTLTMPAADVTISVNTAILTVLPWSGDGTEGSPYIIEYASQLDLLAHRVNGTHGETANDYYNTYFQLGNDISYPHKADGEDGADTESNYEAIGGYYGDGYRSFSGHFNGNNNTISGIRIYKDGSSFADYQGIFGATDSDANIHDLTLADARITGNESTGGIVGYNDGTVTRCHVAADVAVCAEQSKAYFHGGIAGYNFGTIELCTSAATLTTADADNSYCYGGIAGYNHGGTLHDNLAIGATVPAAKNNSYGAIVGNNYNGGSLQCNYYAACKVAGTENATGVGCGYIDDGNGGRITADVTANNGAVSIHTLTLADGITTTTAATVTIGTTGYYAQGTAIDLSYSGTPGNIPLGYQYEDGAGFTASAGTLEGSTLTMPDQDVTVSPALRSTGEAVEVSYVDADGTARTAQAIALDGTESILGIDGTETWYFVGLPTVAFDHTLRLNGNVHLILADGCTMNVTSNADGIDVFGTLTIYGQTDGTGTLNATGFFAGIFTDSGTINISGGRVTATSSNGAGIYIYSGTITISGGTVNATGSYGIYTDSGTITISGGRVTATGGFGIYTNSGTITLGCTTASDFIYVSSYFVGYEDRLNIADGQTLFDEDGNYYSGNGVTIPDGKTLRLYGIALAARQAPDGNFWTTYYNGTTGFTIEGNACAYTATYGAGQLTLHKLGKQIPKNTAVIIVADNDEVSMAATDLDDFTGDNDLSGVDYDTQTSALGTGTFYVLGMTTVGGDQHFGFHRYTGEEMAAHKAFVFVSGSPSQTPARSLTMVFDEASGIESAEADSSLFTLHSSLSTWFTLDGRRLQAKPTAPGIYVNNGKKVVIK